MSWIEGEKAEERVIDITKEVGYDSPDDFGSEIGLKKEFPFEAINPFYVDPEASIAPEFYRRRFLTPVPDERTINQDVLLLADMYIERMPSRN